MSGGLYSLEKAFVYNSFDVDEVMSETKTKNECIFTQQNANGYIQICLERGWGVSDQWRQFFHHLLLEDTTYHRLVNSAHVLCVHVQYYNYTTEMHSFNLIT